MLSENIHEAAWLATRREGRGRGRCSEWAWFGVVFASSRGERLIDSYQGGDLEECRVIVLTSDDMRLGPLTSSRTIVLYIADSCDYGMT